MADEVVRIRVEQESAGSALKDAKADLEALRQQARKETEAEYPDTVRKRNDLRDLAARYQNRASDETLDPQRRAAAADAAKQVKKEQAVYDSDLDRATDERFQKLKTANAEEISHARDKVKHEQDQTREAEKRAAIVNKSREEFTRQALGVGSSLAGAFGAGFSLEWALGQLAQHVLGQRTGENRLARIGTIGGARGEALASAEVERRTADLETEADKATLTPWIRDANVRQKAWELDDPRNPNSAAANARKKFVEGPGGKELEAREALLRGDRAAAREKEMEAEWQRAYDQIYNATRDEPLAERSANAAVGTDMRAHAMRYAGLVNVRSGARDIARAGAFASSEMLGGGGNTDIVHAIQGMKQEMVRQHREASARFGPPVMIDPPRASHRL